MVQTIYLLSDPVTLEPRYVGVTQNTLRKRLIDHCNDRRRTHRTAWIQKIIRNGSRPKVDVLEACEDHQREDAERAWILGFRQAGADLVNVTDGGEGTPGLKFTQEHRAKIKEAKKNIPAKRRSEIASLAAKSRTGYRHSQKTIEKIAESNRGIKKAPHTEEWKKKQSFRAREEKNIEHCKAMAADQKGKPRPDYVLDAMRRGFLKPETRIKMSESARKRPIRKHSFATKEKMSLSRKEYWANKRGKDL